MSGKKSTSKKRAKSNKAADKPMNVTQGPSTRTGASGTHFPSGSTNVLPIDEDPMKDSRTTDANGMTWYGKAHRPPWGDPMEGPYVPLMGRTYGGVDKLRGITPQVSQEYSKLQVTIQFDYRHL